MTTETSLSLYYAFFILIFQFGWAATQVAHLALMPELTTVDAERVELNAFRYYMIFISSVGVLVNLCLSKFSLNFRETLGNIVPHPCAIFLQIFLQFQKL